VSPKIFTPDEANSMLPKLEPLVRRLMARGQELREHQRVLAEFRAQASRSGGGRPGGGVAQAKTECARLLGEIQAGVRQIESWGCVLKDLGQGLVDFLARRGQEEVFLCWRLGEAQIQYWHGLQEGFAGRKPLREDPIG
jgi:hypothetical protein